MVNMWPPAPVVSRIAINAAHFHHQITQVLDAIPLRHTLCSSGYIVAILLLCHLSGLDFGYHCACGLLCTTDLYCVPGKINLSNIYLNRRCWHYFWSSRAVHSSSTELLLEAKMIWFIYMQVFNSFWPVNVICQHRSGSTLAQVMACCLTHQHGSEALTKDQFHSKCLRYWFVKWVSNYTSEITATSPRGQWVKTVPFSVGVQWVFIQTPIRVSVIPTSFH